MLLSTLPLIESIPLITACVAAFLALDRRRTDAVRALLRRGSVQAA